MENISAILFSQHFEEDGNKQEAGFKIFLSIESRESCCNFYLLPEFICAHIDIGLKLFHLKYFESPTFASRSQPNTATLCKAYLTRPCSYRNIRGGLK